MSSLKYVELLDIYLLEKYYISWLENKYAGYLNLCLCWK